MSAIGDMVVRGWENFLARPDGPVNLRFLLQPTIASFLAIRAGLRDARAAKPAYLWELASNPAHRTAMLRSGWKDMRTPFLIAAALDAIYQVIIHRWVYPLELLFTATLLALVPYLLLRGPANRIARRFVRVNPGAKPDGSSGSSEGPASAADSHTDHP